MDPIALNLRNLILTILLISSLSLLPETALALTKPFLVMWLRIKRYHKSFLSGSSKQNNEKFWEIDMTKFEP